MYGEDAVEGSDAREDVLGFDPLQGEWAISFPCEADDLSWVQATLAKQSKRITARDRDADASEETAKSIGAVTLSIDSKGFFGQ